MQVKLLQVIQDQEFERVGGLRTIKVDVRMIAATNRNLFQEVKTGEFREDLFYRLNVFPIHIPPLRDRRKISFPGRRFDKFNRKIERAVREIAAPVQELLMCHGWPGNVRELENLIERLVLISGGDTILLEDIPEELRREIQEGMRPTSFPITRPGHSKVSSRNRWKRLKRG